MKSIRKFQAIAKRPTGMAAIRFYLTLPFTAGGSFVRDWNAGRVSRRASVLAECVSVALLVGIGILINQLYQLGSSVGGPLSLRGVWLGLLIFLTYSTVRLTQILIRQLSETSARYPDIDLTFEVAQKLLLDNQIDVRDVPLFLVVGATPEVEKSMTESSFVGTDVKIDAADLPVHVFAGQDAIWVTLPGASAVSEQTRRWGEALHNPGQGDSHGRMSLAEKEGCHQRLRYALARLRSVRSGVVPVNGVLLYVPVQWLLDSECTRLLDTIKLDMFTIQTELGIQCELVLLFHQIEQRPEFAEWLDSFPESVRQGRFGCTLPQFSVHQAEESVQLHKWLYAFLRQQIFGLFAADISNSRNVALFRLLNLFDGSRDMFVRILSNVFSADVESKLYLGGVYFTELSNRRRTFFDGVVARLLKDHDEVIGWSPSTLRRERVLRRAATVASGLTLCVFLLDLYAFLAGVIGR